MTLPAEQSVWLSETALCSFNDLLELSGLSQVELNALVDTGVLEPAAEQISGGSVFHASCIVQVRTARRLRDDFGLDTSGLTLALNLLSRIDDLQRQLAELSTFHRR
ncbi:MAG: chaperone modulator CbpM [Herbaspirillum sp.]